MLQPALLLRRLRPRLPRLRPRLLRLTPLLVAACSHAAAPSSAPGRAAPAAAPATPAAPTATPSSWPVPTGWKSEVIPFPLDFAPSLAHRGVEELRFPPGMFDPTAAGYWSYAFVWRLDDRAELDAATLGAELTAYFRGLVAAVDDKHRIAERDAITATATATTTAASIVNPTTTVASTANPTTTAASTATVTATSGASRFDLRVHTFDAFKTAQPIELVGWAERRACGSGALWIVVLAREDAPLRGQLDALAASARCER